MGKECKEVGLERAASGLVVKAVAEGGLHPANQSNGNTAITVEVEVEASADLAEFSMKGPPKHQRHSWVNGLKIGKRLLQDQVGVDRARAHTRARTG